MFRLLFRTVKWAFIIVAALFALLVLLSLLQVLIEDIGGPIAWANAKKKLEAAGVSLDPKTYIPPPVPDSENLAALPLFQPEPDPSHHGAKKLLALDRAVAPVYENFFYPSIETYHPGKLPYLGDLFRNEQADPAVIQQQLSDFCTHATPPIKVPAHATATDMLSLICPALGDLRSANVTRPYCRFNRDFSTTEPEALEPIFQQLKLAKTLAYEERLALLTGQPQLSMDDFDVDWKIISGLQKDPLIVAEVVTMAIFANHLNIIHEGLVRHSWNDQQLQKLDADLGKIDFLAESQLCQRGDLVIYQIPLIARCKHDRSSLMNEAEKVSREETGQPLSKRDYALLWVRIWLTSNGRYDYYLAEYAPLILPGDKQLLDISARRVFPERVDAKLQTTSIVAKQWCNNARYFAFAQVQVDEARIACRLERYHLAHGTYPATLDELVPTYGSDLPQDIMNGEPYHYKLMSDGKYLLYSVGWDQKDDGGVYDANSSVSSSLDWVWANYPYTEKSK